MSSSVGERTPSRLLLDEESRLSNQTNWIDQVAAILAKPPQNRNHLEHSYLLKKLLNIKYFQELAKSSDPEVIKHVVKKSKIVRPHSRKIVIAKDDPINYIYVIIKGKVGIEQDLYAGEQIVDQHKISRMFNVLENQAKAQAKMKGRRLKKLDKLDDTAVYESKIFQQHEQPISKIKFTDQLGEQESFGDQIKSLQNNRKYNAVAINDTILLEIKIQELLKAIQYYSEKKLGIQHQFFRKFRCFDLLEDHQLKNLIQTCKTDERGKNQLVFKQNDFAPEFYLLYEGQVCLVKNAQLFVENPNKLYTSRKVYLQNKKNSTPLPYANLEKLYNYRPKQQKIQLGILEKNNIFGEEQAFLRTPRQTDAKVCSNIARFYVVQIVDLQIILKEKKYELQDFRDFLFANLTRKKIMYRQQKFSEVLNLRNKNQLDYFYLGQQGKEEKQSPMKFKIQKINHKVQQLSKGKKQLSAVDIEDRPYFDPFNFTKLLSNRQEISMDDPESPEQKKLQSLTHTTRFIQKQINSSFAVNKIRNPIHYKINLKDPLFEPTYFENLNKQIRKMEQQYKKKRFTLRPIESKSLPGSKKTKKEQS